MPLTTQTGIKETETESTTEPLHIPIDVDYLWYSEIVFFIIQIWVTATQIVDNEEGYITTRSVTALKQTN